VRSRNDKHGTAEAPWALGCFQVPSPPGGEGGKEERKQEDPPLQAALHKLTLHLFCPPTYTIFRRKRRYLTNLELVIHRKKLKTRKSMSNGQFRQNR